MYLDLARAEWLLNSFLEMARCLCHSSPGYQWPTPFLLPLRNRLVLSHLVLCRPLDTLGCLRTALLHPLLDRA